MVLLILVYKTETRVIDLETQDILDINTKQNTSDWRLSYNLQ